jgi:heme exporter protein C
MTLRESGVRIARVGAAITVIALIGVAAVYVRAMAYTPVEATQGAAQKIFYIHVPAAWAGLMAFVVTGLLSILYLWLKDRRIDLAAAASAEVGVAFSVVILTTGPIWGKPIWGTWWTWDARLTSTLFLFLLFVGYIVLRGVLTDPGMRGRFSAVIGIMGMILVPFIHLTVYMFRTMHPAPIVLKPSRPSLPDDMLTTLMMSVAVFSVLYVGFLMLRYSLGLLREAYEEELADAS